MSQAHDNPRYVDLGNESTYVVGRSFLETMIRLLQASSDYDDDRARWADWITELLARERCPVEQIPGRHRDAR